jgi:hypothetical protein
MHSGIAYLEGVTASSVTRSRIDDTKPLAVDAVGTRNVYQGTMRIHRGDGSQSKENGGEDSLGEHGELVCEDATGVSQVVQVNLSRRREWLEMGETT